MIHDIAIPIPNELKNKYTYVFDGGLLEHVFNYPVALKNTMDMVNIGGHLVLATTGNNFFGHGFYQFSPELFYSVLREENGFVNTRVYLCDSLMRWYLVKDPRSTHQRTEISPSWPNVLLYITSKKISDVPDSITAFQSDYEELWKKNADEPNKTDNYKAILKKIYDKSPLLFRRYVKAIYNKIKFRTLFTPIDL